ncbi:MAG: hypothetical protein PHF25_06970 [Candidatus Margulisbacteria bacterium]|nr:hypothetical protein [Candidatus Margulisiibacteriota bacterium]
MTDLEKFIELYRSVGIELEVKQEEFKLQTIYLHPTFDNDSKLDGVNGCFSSITFDKDGKFVMQGFWDD